MARGVALSALRARLKAMIRDTQETNSAADTELNYALSEMQLHLCARNDWPFMEDRWNVTLADGTRYYSIPTTNVRSIASTINFNRPVDIQRLDSNFYAPLFYGIGPEHFNQYDSDAGEKADPAQRWSIDTNTGDTSQADQFEIWPIPASAGTLLITGQRAPRTLSSDSDKADLDDLLLIYFVAADILNFRKQADAGTIAQRAADYLNVLRAGYPTKDMPLVFGQSRMMRDRTNVKLIAVT